MSEISHQESGKGTPIVLLHGFCETSQIWDEFVPRLSDNFKVLCPDLPGFGKSKMPSVPFSINDVAAQVASWIHDMDLRKPVIIGHSLGGYVALAIANKNENTLGGIGLFHSTALPDNEEKKANRNKVIEFVNRNGVQAYIDTFVSGLFYSKDSPEVKKAHAILSQARQEALTGYVAAMRDRADQTVLIARFTRPILFLCGANDELIPVESIQKQAKMAQKAILKILPETGHMGMLEAPAKSAREVAQFVSLCQ